MRSARLDGPVDLDGFRRAARRLFAQGVPPEQVNWSICEGVDPGLLDQVSLPVSPDPDPVHSAPLSVPPAFVDLMESVILHRDPQRFGLLYQLLWRLQREASLRRDPLDAQWMHAQRMAHAVHHDMHKMKAFVRFRPIDRGPAEPPLHVAWFEPQHHVVEAVAPFFAARFATLRWTILTPLRSVFWDGERLALGAPARRDQAPPADAGEQLWLTYYEHIFNPARLKLAMMKKEMPVLEEPARGRADRAAVGGGRGAQRGHGRAGADRADPADPPHRAIAAGGRPRAHARGGACGGHPMQRLPAARRRDAGRLRRGPAAAAADVRRRTAG
jgi:probable DNA metabolism protein